MKQLPKRILSIDALRALTMFLMIFVNDVAGVKGIPQWIQHTAATDDGMGFSDLIFPAFLFIVGLSLPLAIQSRKNKGDTLLDLLGYVGLRAIALIVMGFFHVNLGSYNAELTGVPYPIYTIALTVGFFLIWMAYPKTLSKRTKYSLITIGVLIVGSLAYLYKGGTITAPKGLTPSWWGILGIIGWAYLVTALISLITQEKIKYLLLAFLGFSILNIATHLKLINLGIWIIGDASSITLMMGGLIASVLYSALNEKAKLKQLHSILAFAGLLSILFGFLIRPYAGGISKIYATPAWVFICLGIAILIFQIFVYLIDQKGKVNWFSLIKPAGTSTLTCYLVPYLLYATLNLIGFHYPSYFNQGAGGMLRSLLVAFVVIRLVALMEKKNIRLKV